MCAIAGTLRPQNADFECSRCHDAILFFGAGSDPSKTYSVRPQLVKHRSVSDSGVSLRLSARSSSSYYRLFDYETASGVKGSYQGATMTKSIGELVNELELQLPWLARKSVSDEFAKDVHEAVEYWSHLGRYVLQNDTRVNFPVRAEGQLLSLHRLEEALNNRPTEEQELYKHLFLRSSELLGIIRAVMPPQDGHLGVLRVIRHQFRFLETQYNFAITKEEPTGLRFSSGAVYIHLAYATKSFLSGQFGPEPEGEHFFGITDLLFLHRDNGYQSVPDDLGLKTEGDVERWFAFLANTF
jgi:hypothetical protein